MYVSVEDLKKHLNIDYEEDDGYLEQLSRAAENAVERFVQQPLKELEDEDGRIPESLMHAIRLLAGGFYANREPVAFAAASEIPFGLMFLLSQYRKLS